MKYRVEFEFMVADLTVTDGKYHKDYLDNNGTGFTYDEAEEVAMQLRMNEACYTRYVEIVEM